MTQTWGIHWFRRDLKVAGNAALRQSFVRHKGRVLGLFAFDQTFLSRPDFSHDRFHFFMESMEALRQEMREAGGDLLVLGQGPDEAFLEIKKQCAAANVNLPSSVSWNRDYEPFARQRDERIGKLLTSWNIETITHRDHLLIEPHEILNGQGKPYQVYTAFAKKWFELFASEDIQERITIQHAGIKYLEQRERGKAPKLFDLTWSQLLGDHVPADQCAAMLHKNKLKLTVPIPEAGSLIAWTTAKSWAKKMAAYGDTRDIPSIDGTSRLSMFLKNGTITAPQIIAGYDLEHCSFKAGDGATKFLQELVWREFYYHIIWHSPRVEHEAYQMHYKDLIWDNDETMFEAWKQGKTGYPIVDAGMRQLLTTGWMHNRVRMIVASFLTKDLLIDWRWGERWFMEKLLDGDLAPNNGGWQWAASTGCDAQPYFRIFNPESQSTRFDPDGTYIRTFIPELKDAPSKEIHNPPSALRLKMNYPAPIVVHARQRIRALMLYKR